MFYTKYMTKSTFDLHQIKIAKATLKMTDIGVLIMGGMTKQEARQILDKRVGQKKREEIENS